MANDALFLALSQAKSQPSKALRAVQSGGQAAQDVLGGYMQGLGVRRQMAEYPLLIAQKKAAIFDNYSKLADAVGPDRASQIMGPTLQQAGININEASNPDNFPSIGNGATSSGSPSSQQLSTMGNYGKKVLEGRKTAQEIDIAGPKDPQAYKASIMQSGLMSPQAFDDWAKGNMDQNGQIPSKNADYLEKSLGLKAAGNRGEFYHTQVGRNQLELLPSLQPPNSAPGAAYQVKLAARQGKSLIANATSPQNLQLASNDLARAIQRATPTSETIGASNYGNSLATIWGQLSQKITSDPNSPDVPLLRKQLYDTFNELDKAATPWIGNHLQNMEDNGTNSSYGKNWPAVKNRELGLNIPDVPFNAAPSTGSAQNPNISNGIPTQPNPKDPAGLFQ